MFKTKTTIVLGAGASKEANLPTGAELKERIASILDIRFSDFAQVSGDSLVREALHEFVRQKFVNLSINPHLEAAWRIRDAMPLAMSIDNFIDAHQGDDRLERCGKLAIVRAILEAERNSPLYFNTLERDQKLDQPAVQQTWLNAFMQLLSENCRPDHLAEVLSSVKMIIFNYDRCVEHFLYHSLQTYYGLEQQRAAALVRGIEIYHPYGTVGQLPWWGREHSVEFGGEVSAPRLLDLASQIKTFTEGTDPNSSAITAIRKAMADSQIVMFLGFAFHPQNLALIRPTRAHTSPDTVRYFGTAKGISDSDSKEIVSELSQLGGAKAENIAIRNDLTSAGLFREYWRCLSRS